MTKREVTLEDVLIYEADLGEIQSKLREAWKQNRGLRSRIAELEAANDELRMRAEELSAQTAIALCDAWLEAEDARTPMEPLRMALQPRLDAEAGVAPPKASLAGAKQVKPMRRARAARSEPI